jgi:gamma-glutamyl-gamma-aminobutyrate hydrolase PuuD
MTLYTPTPMHAVADGSLSDLLAHWIGEQIQHDDHAKRERPHIGILAAGGTLRDGGWPIYGGDAPTAHAILEAGGFPSIIPPLPFLEGCDPSDLLRDDHTFALYFDVLWPVVRHLDGLVFSGGGDLSASLYRQQLHPQAETPDLWRDTWERYLALLAWLLCIPTLGICRGMHLMNVVLGGTMYQDLRTEWPKDRPPLVRHRARGRVSASNWVTHPVQFARQGSRLARAVKGRGELGRPALDAVLSMHHQAVERLAPGLEVSATAPDGVIEAFEETASSRWWVATQFHPEWSTQLRLQSWAYLAPSLMPVAPTVPSLARRSNPGSRRSGSGCENVMAFCLTRRGHQRYQLSLPSPSAHRSSHAPTGRRCSSLTQSGSV